MLYYKPFFTEMLTNWSKLGASASIPMKDSFSSFGSMSQSTGPAGILDSAQVGIQAPGRGSGKLSTTTKKPWINSSVKLFYKHRKSGHYCCLYSKH